MWHRIPGLKHASVRASPIACSGSYAVPVAWAPLPSISFVFVLLGLVWVWSGSGPCLPPRSPRWIGATLQRRPTGVAGWDDWSRIASGGEADTVHTPRTRKRPPNPTVVCVGNRAIERTREPRDLHQFPEGARGAAGTERESADRGSVGPRTVRPG